MSFLKNKMRGGFSEMKSQGLLIVAIACLAFGVLTFDAQADGRHPASCLLFPKYDTGTNHIAVMTITNTCDDTVYVRLVWVDRETCTPEDQWIELTAGDTFTFLDQAMNPEFDEQGFMYAYVVESIGSKIEEDADCLIGQELVFQAWPTNLNWGINAVPFEAKNLVKDGKLHLDGVEYDCAPYKLYFPRFFGQGLNAGVQVDSYMVLINLVGGQFFEQQADVLVYNDNEQAFSSTVYFGCWDLFKLEDVSGATKATNLFSSKHDPLELWDGNNNPLVDHVKTGWIILESDWVWNPQTSFVHDDPCLYGVLIEKIGGSLSAADLPWQVEDPAVNKHAILWSTSPWGM
jgi:hypothetical protein